MATKDPMELSFSGHRNSAKIQMIALFKPTADRDAFVNETLNGAALVNEREETNE